MWWGLAVLRCRLVRWAVFSVFSQAAEVKSWTWCWPSPERGLSSEVRRRPSAQGGYSQVPLSLPHVHGSLPEPRSPPTRKQLASAIRARTYCISVFLSPLACLFVFPSLASCPLVMVASIPAASRLGAPSWGEEDVYHCSEFLTDTMEKKQTVTLRNRKRLQKKQTDRRQKGRSEPTRPSSIFGMTSSSRLTGVLVYASQTHKYTSANQIMLPRSLRKALTRDLLSAGLFGAFWGTNLTQSSSFLCFLWPLVLTFVCWTSLLSSDIGADLRCLNVCFWNALLLTFVQKKVCSAAALHLSPVLCRLPQNRWSTLCFVKAAELKSLTFFQSSEAGEYMA